MNVVEAKKSRLVRTMGDLKLLAYGTNSSSDNVTKRRRLCKKLLKRVSYATDTATGAGAFGGTMGASCVVGMGVEDIEWKQEGI